MKKIFKCALPLLLAAIMLMGSASMSFFAVEAQAAEYQVGDIVEFGFYPQSEVTDEATLSALNSQTLNWVSYGYYSGDGEKGSMVQSDYMKYADVEYNGNKYRAVYFTEYRPGFTFKGYIYRDDNGYTTNTTYWFKYEPLKWRVLDPKEGFIMSETIIDSQAYSNTVYYNDEYYNDSSYTNYANDYETSSIREWLNDDFYNTAFTSDQQSSIKTTTLNNSAYDSQYDSATTNDKVFILSYDEVQNTSYGFDSSIDSSTTRVAKGSDYAKCQGLYVSPDGNSYWNLRSPGDISTNSCRVYDDGRVRDISSVNHTKNGVRPALKISNLSSIESLQEISLKINNATVSNNPENDSNAQGGENTENTENAKSTENTLPTTAIIGIAAAAVVVVGGVVAGVVLGKKKKVK